MTKRQKVPSRRLLVALGIPTVFLPGLILAATLGWDWRQGLSELKRVGGFRQSAEIFPKKVLVSQVLDGDTFETSTSLTVRMIGIDAPNRGEKGYEAAKEYLADLISGESVILEYDYYQDDKYGRLLAYVWESCLTQLGCRDGQRMVNWVMLKKGYADFITYQGRRALKYEKLLSEASDSSVGR